MSIVAAPSPMIPPLHGLRAIAALTVVVAHTTMFTDFGLVNYSGSIGVMLFFVLSGFLMSHLYLRQSPTLTSVATYVQNRVARIYPLFAAVVVLSTVLFALFGKSYPFRLTPELAVEHLLLFGDYMTLWTVSVEFQFYAFFGAMWIIYATILRRSDAALTAFLVAVAVLLWWRGFNDDRIALDGYLHVFLTGMLVEQVYRRSPAWARRLAGFAIAPLLVVYVVAFVSWTAIFGGRETFNLVWLVTLIALLVLSVLIAPASLYARMLGSRPLVWLGEISFGIYLLHRPVAWLWKSVLPAGTHGYVIFGLTVVATVAFSWLSYLVIERPCRLALRRVPIPFIRTMQTSPVARH